MIENQPFSEPFAPNLLIDTNILIAVVPRAAFAKQAVNALADAGFAFADMALAGPTDQSKDNLIFLHNKSSRLMLSRRHRSFWEKLWPRFDNGLVFTIPSSGPVSVLGFMAPAMMSASQEACLSAGVGSFFAAFWQSYLPIRTILQCIQALKDDKFLVMVKGDADEIERARSVIDFIDLPHIEWLAPEYAHTLSMAQDDMRQGQLASLQ